ncbi:O-methyltransferase family protein [Raphanus sativus]|uniref:Indole glucosinolate O-methyltransferase 1-like n=1 Tax=Raphanus sativus TaxID=3726 RepID=A0A9W3CIH7_RAPSA|nr:indole glucosinolate O-methyltransferase 1-like [Raphanus sativus]KAJ4874306.1 O-methyltransferase family protein [Raphanus sativus]
MANQLLKPLTNSPKPALTKEEDSEEMVALQAERMVYSLSFPMVFKAALELGVIDTLASVADGTWLSPSEIASRLPTKPTNPEAPMLLDRMLRLLASHSVFKCRVVETGKTERVYAAEPVCKLFLKDSDGSGSLLSFFMLCQNHVIFKSLSHLKDVILEGKDAFVSAHGMRAFEYLGSDKQFAEMFNLAMSDFSTLVMKKILEVYKGFKDVDTLVDVGGGVGTVLGLVTSKYPHIKGINFDLASVVANAPRYPGVQHVAGDMLIEVPKGDAIFMKWVFHAWDDENCIKILKNCWSSLPEKGKVIVVEMVIPKELKSDDCSSNIGLTVDMFMLSLRGSGGVRTLSQYEALAYASGFRRCEFICRSFSFSLMEFHK